MTPWLEWARPPAGLHTPTAGGETPHPASCDAQRCLLIARGPRPIRGDKIFARRAAPSLGSPRPAASVARPRFGEERGLLAGAAAMAFAVLAWPTSVRAARARPTAVCAACRPSSGAAVFAAAAAAAAAAALLTVAHPVGCAAHACRPLPAPSSRAAALTSHGLTFSASRSAAVISAPECFNGTGAGCDAAESPLIRDLLQKSRANKERNERETLEKYWDGVRRSLGGRSARRARSRCPKLTACVPLLPSFLTRATSRTLALATTSTSRSRRTARTRSSAQRA
jgi:hypothetical protein